MTDRPTQLHDQTRFFDEGVYFETKPPTPELETKQPFLESKRGKLFLIGFAILGFLLVIIGLAAVFGTPADNEIDLEDDEPTQQTRVLSETEKKVQLIKDLLKSADPTKEQDPFPSVDLTIRLDSQER